MLSIAYEMNWEVQNLRVKIKSQIKVDESFVS